jgi:hypothetical protein
MVDDTLAPRGKHVVNLFGGHAPYDLGGKAWTEEDRAGFVKTVYATMDDVAPGFSSGIIDAQVLLPADIESIINSPHGHIFHGELALEQLFFQRPAPHYADYRSPIRGLYQCGSSAVVFQAYPATMQHAGFCRTGGHCLSDLHGNTLTRMDRPTDRLTKASLLSRPGVLPGFRNL